jgi:hypothetical protein
VAGRHDSAVITLLGQQVLSHSVEYCEGFWPCNPPCNSFSSFCFKMLIVFLFKASFDERLFVFGFMIENFGLK